MERKPRRGRPKKGQELGERVQLSLRVTPTLKRKLDAGSVTSGRSQSQEAEFRLERSFDRQDLFAEVLELKYGRRIAGLMMTVGETMSFAVETYGNIGARGNVLPPSSNYSEAPPQDDDWLNDAHAYNELVKAVVAMLDNFKPAGPPAPRPELAELLAKRDIPRFVTSPLVEALKGHVTGDNPLTRWADQARPFLVLSPGPAARREK